MELPIDLGEEREDTFEPSGPMSVSDSKDEIVYPKFCYRGPKDLDLPESGTMVIQFRKTQEEYHADEETGEHTFYECEITVKKILAAKEEPDIRPSKRDTSTEDALDELARENSDEEGY